MTITARMFPAVAATLVLCLAATAAEEGPRPGENIARGKSYRLDPRPAYAHCTDPDDRTQLTDGVYSRGYFWTQKPTVGWSHVGSVTITIDLGSVQPIRGASFNTAAGTAGVEWPVGVTMLASDDGTNFFFAGELTTLDAQHGNPPAGKYAVHRYWTDELRTHGRFVSFLVSPGGPFVFVDEIEIYKGEADWVNLAFTGDSVTDPGEYRVQLCIERRLRDDLRALREADTGRKLAAEFDAIERGIPDLPKRRAADFRAVLPLNELHGRIFRAQAALWRENGAAPLRAWFVNGWDPMPHIAPAPTTGRTDGTVGLMPGEYRSCAFNLANAGEREASVRVKITGLPGGDNPSWISVHEVAWTDTKKGKPVAAALPTAKRESGDYVISATAGLLRQVWLTVHPTEVPAGLHRGRILLRADGQEQSLSLAVRIFPLQFPARPTLHVGGWDYTDADSRYEITPRNRDAVIAHLRERFVDSPWATSAVLPVHRDTAFFDRWLARWSGARQYCVFASVHGTFDGAAMGTPEFDAKVGAWIAFWAAHARKQGVNPEQLAVLLVDEPHEAKQDEVILAWARAIRAAKTGIRIWEDPTYLDPAKANQDMMAACDVLCPNRPMMLSAPPSFRDYYAQRRAAGAELAYYSCSGPVRALDPYSYHRLQAWTCWQQGARSSFFWAFGDSGGGSSWNEYAMRGASAYTPLFLDATSATAGKHMEAIRESVEDYEYLVMLRDRIEAARKAGATNKQFLERAGILLATAAERVLGAGGADALLWNQPKDRSIADGVRLEILELLAEFEARK